MKENETEPTYIYLSENFRIFRCDDRNFEVEQQKEVVSRPNRYVKETTVSVKWVSIGYFSHLHQAVSRVLSVYEEELTQKEKMTLGDIVSELKEIKESLVKAVKESGIKVTDFVKVPDGRGRKAGEVKVAKVKGNSSVKAEKPDTKPVKRGRGRPRKVKV